MQTVYHIPVMANACIRGLNLKSGSVVVDATYGGGGHSALILNEIPDGKLFGFDQDDDASKNIINDNRFFFIGHNFRYIKNFLRYYGIDKVDAILADLGVSSHHFDETSRGFSFRSSAMLDMRMNQKAAKNAYIIVNEYNESNLIRVFKEYGEITNAPKLAALIISKRAEKPIEATSDLREIILHLIPRGIEMKYLAQVFQAIRIEVNDELSALKEFLESSLEILCPGGRLVVITYHSLEARIVKNYFKSGNFEGKARQDFFGNFISPFRLINKKAITPDDDELRSNPRSRSAKLRIAEKI